MRRARDGEPAAMRDLYERHVDRIHRLVWRMTRNEEAARDLTQDAFVRAFEGLGAFRGDSSFGTWLHSITVRLVLDGARRSRWWSERVVPMDGAEAAIPHAEGERSVVRRMVRRRVREAVQELPDIYRLVVVMHEIEGYTHAEIAAALGVAEGTSKARLSRAKEQLRARLSDLEEEEPGLRARTNGSGSVEGGVP